MGGTGRLGRALAATAVMAGAMVVAPLAAPAWAAPMTFDVNTAGNVADTFIDGNCDTNGAPGLQCTLRGAIAEANANAGPDTITFSLASPYRIDLTSAGLPAVTSPVTIDGTSLTGYSPAGGVIVRIDGRQNTTFQIGLDLQAGSAGSVVKGLEIVRNTNAGIRLGSDGNTVAGNFIGTTAGGAANCTPVSSSCGNYRGVAVEDSSNNVIGGTAVADRNVISNNTYLGIDVTTVSGSSTGTSIVGNYVGVAPNGTTAMGGQYGIYLHNSGGSDPAATIGGTAAGAGNLISGNGQDGAIVENSGATVAGNVIGLNAAGSAAVPNGGSGGLRITGSTATATIGGSTAAHRNVISGNAQEGIEINGPNGAITIEGNYVGTDVLGLADLGNGWDGIYASNTENVTITDNVISGNGANYGINLSSGSGASIRDNVVGLDAPGAVALPNGSTGVYAAFTFGTVVDGNTISGNPCQGLDLYASLDAVVTNNRIGTDVTGTVDVGNGCTGLNLYQSSDAVIGAPGAGNLVSGNANYGIHLDNTSDTRVQANLVGTTASGTSPLPNDLSPLWLSSSTRVAVGGALSGEGNVIGGVASACCEAGVYFSSADANAVVGNRVGIDAAGNALANGWVGVYLDGSSDTNVIGGTAAGAGNVVANSGDAGVVVYGVRNTVVGNSIRDNGQLGIDLGHDGVTANDLGDPDSGANRRQNFPVVATSASNAGGTQVTGTLNSRPNRQYQLDFYANTSCDASLHGEGAVYLGSSTVSTNGSGNASFSASLAVSAPAASEITATATDVVLGDTSEFSACVTNQGGLPAASVGNASAAENAGNLTFTVTLSSAPVFTPVTVAYQTAHGTATGADYTPTSGTVTFGVGETSKPVVVPITNDTVDEVDETFTLTLSNPSNALIASGGGQATGTIVDNDAPPSLSISNAVTVTETDAGTVNQTFTVTLSPASSLPVDVVVSTVPGVAAENVDYQANAAYLSFAPGQTSKTFVTTVLPDVLDENNNEAYFAHLFSPTNATINDGVGQALIADNDAVPQVSVSDVTVNEGNSGNTQFVFTVSIPVVSGRQVVATLNTANGTATSAAGTGRDFTAKNVNIFINPGSTSRVFTVLVRGDTTIEADETFLVNIVSTNAFATIGDGQGVGTITNDDCCAA